MAGRMEKAIFEFDSIITEDVFTVMDLSELIQISKYGNNNDVCIAIINSLKAGFIIGYRAGLKGKARKLYKAVQDTIRSAAGPHEGNCSPARPNGADPPGS